MCVCTYLLRVPQVKEVQETLVTHLLVGGEHDDVAAEIEAARPDGRVGVEQRQLLPCRETDGLKRLVWHQQGMEGQPQLGC